MTRTRISPFVLALLCIVLLGFPQSVGATETQVAIRQTGRFGVIGKWTLLLPGPADRKMTSNDARVNPAEHTAKNLPPGTYTLVIEPAPGTSAGMVMRVEMDGVITLVGPLSPKGTAAENSFPFTLEMGEHVSFVVEHLFNGRMDVRSTPSDVPFTVTGPNHARFSAATPASFTNLPPYYYSVFFGRKEGCSAVEPQKRLLPADGRVTFVATLRCTAPSTEPEEPTPSAPEVPPARSLPATDGRVIVQHLPLQSEVLSGGTARFLLRVRNLTNATIRDLRARVLFDSQVFQMESDPPERGQVRRNAVLWRIDELPPRGTWEVVFNGNVPEGMPQGTFVTLTATVAGEQLATKTGAIARVGVTTLPATGGATDALFLLLSGVCALALALGSRLRSIVHG